MPDTPSNEKFIGALIKAAQIRNEIDPAIWQSWLELAELEAKSLSLADAFKHAMKGIALFKRPNKWYWSYDTCFNFSCIVDLANAFANAGDDVNAERLLASATKKIEAVYGNAGPYYAFQNACLAVYYFGRNSQDKAMHYVDLALKCPVRSLQLQCGSVVGALGKCQAILIDKQDHKTALEICTKIIEKQSSEIADDDARRAASLIDRAKILVTMREFDDALSDYRAALAILKLYGWEFREPRELSALPKLLHELGREDEAKEVEAQIKELARYKSYENEDASMPRKDSEPMERIPEYQKALNYARQEYPYGERVKLVATWMLPLAKSLRNWALAREVSEALCIYYEHQNDSLIGGSGPGCILESLGRFDYYQSLIEADLQLNNVSSAVANLYRAQSCIPEISYYENLGFAALALECNEISLAKHFAVKAEPLVLEEFYLFPNRPQLSDVWNQLGEPDRAATALQDEGKVMAQRQKLHER